MQQDHIYKTTPITSNLKPLNVVPSIIINEAVSILNQPLIHMYILLIPIWTQWTRRQKCRMYLLQIYKFTTLRLILRITTSTATHQWSIRSSIRTTPSTHDKHTIHSCEQSLGHWRTSWSIIGLNERKSQHFISTRWRDKPFTRTVFRTDFCCCPLVLCGCPIDGERSWILLMVLSNALRVLKSLSAMEFQITFIALEFPFGCNCIYRFGTCSWISQP